MFSAKPKMGTSPEIGEVRMRDLRIEAAQDADRRRCALVIAMVLGAVGLPSSIAFALWVVSTWQ